MIECSQPVCLELFSDVPQLGRFFLRDEGKTIAIGKVTALGPKKKEAQWLHTVNKDSEALQKNIH